MFNKKPDSQEPKPPKKLEIGKESFTEEEALQFLTWMKDPAANVYRALLQDKFDENIGRLRNYMNPRDEDLYVKTSLDILELILGLEDNFKRIYGIGPEDQE